ALLEMKLFENEKWSGARTLYPMTNRCFEVGYNPT
ncbi:MAG: hypothetical protein JWQ16_1328, partial [Novosphingobium sp.]|nr:hypothetical protein [Novosphingobium sp.]